jgi:putative transposase
MRDVGLIPAERGIVVSYETVRRCRPRLGDQWHMDEVFIRIQGAQHYLWRAVDQDGVVLDILIQAQRDATVAKRFFKRLLAGSHCDPRVIVTPSVTATFCRMTSCRIAPTVRVPRRLWDENRRGSYQPCVLDRSF